MGIIQTIKRWWEALWQKEVQDKFGVETIKSEIMEAALREWVKIYQGKPYWVNPDDIESFNFAKKLCSETARLTTLALGIAVEGSARAEWINGFMEGYVTRMKNGECEKACAFGYIVLKPSGDGIDYVMPWDFFPTHAMNGKVDGVFLQTTIMRRGTSGITQGLNGSVLKWRMGSAYTGSQIKRTGLLQRKI